MKPSALAAFALAVGTLLAGPEMVAGEPPSQEIPRGKVEGVIYKAHSLVCDPNQTQYVTFLNQKVEPLHPEKMPREIYQGVWQIFQQSATEMDQFMRDITTYPMEEDDFTFALNEKYDKIQIENRKRINSFLEKWPAPHGFTSAEFGKIKIDLDTHPKACAFL